MVNAEFERLEESIKDRLDNTLYLVENLKRQAETNEKLDDVGLRLYQKNWYFGYYGRDCTWTVTNFNQFDEFKDDAVMQELARIYENLEKCKDKLKRIEKVSLGLSGLATHMANRSLKEEDYSSLLDGKHPVLQEAYSLFPVLLV
jgi:hypothetical protein